MALEPSRPADAPEEPPPAPEPGIDSAAFTRSGLLFYGAMAVAAVVWRVGFYHEPIWRSGGETTVPWLWALGAGVAAGLGVVGLSGVLTRFTSWGEALSREMAGMLRGLTLADAVLLAVASGLAEEMFFRGALQPRVGLWVAGLLFGGVHLVPRAVFLPWTVFAVLSGWLLGWLFEATGSLLAPVVAHTVVNGINLPRLAIEARREAAVEPEDGTSAPPP